MDLVMRRMLLLLALVVALVLEFLRPQKQCPAVERRATIKRRLEPRPGDQPHIHVEKPDHWAPPDTSRALGTGGSAAVPFIHSATNDGMQAILNRYHDRQRGQMIAILATPNPIAPVNWMNSPGMS
jgi:hypothetical protein